MDTVYHAKDPRFISYLQHFDEMECAADPLGGFRNCSVSAMNLVGMKYSNISRCIAEDKYDKDIPHNAMNQNLRQLSKHRKLNYTLPYVTVNDQKLVDKPLITSTIFQEYCSFFPTVPEQPLACHACKGCSNVRDCLCTLECNNKEFDPTRLKPEVLGLTAPPKPEVEATDAPTKLYEDNDTQLVSDMVLEIVMEEEGADQDNTFESDHHKQQKGNGEAIFSTFLVALATVGCLGGGLYCRQLLSDRTNKRSGNLTTGKHPDCSFGLSYSDNPDNNDGISLEKPANNNTNMDLDGSRGKGFLDDSDALKKFPAYSDQPATKPELEKEVPAVVC